jgi:hypothetical protein
MLRIATTPQALLSRAGSMRVDRVPTLALIRPLAGSVALFLAAYLLWDLVDPSYAIIVPALVFAGLAAYRWPAATMVGAFGFDSAYGSLKAFLGLPANGLATTALTSLLVATVGGFVFGKRNRAAIIWPAVVAIGLYLFLMLIMVPFSPDSGPAFKVVRTSGLYLLAPLLIAYGPWPRGTHERVRVAAIVAVLLAASYATLRWGIGASSKEKGQVTSSAFNSIGTQSKVQGSFPSGVELGLWTAMVMPFALGCMLTLRGRMRIVAAVALPLCAIGLLGSRLRIGLVAAIAGCAGVLLAMASGSVALFPTVIGHDPETVKRYSNILSPSTDYSYQGRLAKWEQALVDIRGHPFGHGLGTVGPESTSQRFLSNTNISLDSSYLRIAFEQGLLVMGIYGAAALLLLGGLVRRGVWSPERSRAGPAIAAAGTLVAMLVLMFADVVTTVPATLPAWIIIGLGVAPFTRLEAPTQTPSARS